MPESLTPIYHFPQWQDGDRRWGSSINNAFLSIESLIKGAYDAVTAEMDRAELAETSGFVSWGEMAGSKTWQEMYDMNITWAQASNMTWGELFGISTWQRVLDAWTNWQQAGSVNWGDI